VGRRGDAINLYKIRKADILRGVKMPANMKDKGVRFSVLAQEAIDWYINHERKDVRNFKGRMKFILEAFGDRVADEIKPSDIDSWLGAHDWSAATKNRYKNVFGKTFKIALADGKVTSNPPAWSSSELRTTPASGFCPMTRRPLANTSPTKANGELYYNARIISVVLSK